MAITAAQVNELRQRTGLGMMECKKALQENDGDVEKAIEYFRKKGVKTSVAGREAGEGRVGAFLNAEKTRGVLVEVKCNTDFTARNEVVAEVLKLAGERLLANPSAEAAEDPAIKDKLVAVSQQTGENVHLGRTQVVEGKKVGKFEYTVTNKAAALVAVDSADVPDAVLADIALHVVAMQPVPTRLSREEVPADVARPAMTRIEEEVAAMGKPPEVSERIRESKLKLFYAEQDVLADQPFINADKFKGTISEYAGKSNARVTGFGRLEIGRA